MKTEPTPWRQWLALAFRVGLAPDRFWRLSLKEWRALAAPSEPTLKPDDLAALMARYPDR